MILTLTENERVIASGDGYQIERRCRQGGTYEWQPVTFHGTLADAVTDFIQGKILSLPNDNSCEFVRAVEGVMATVTHTVNRALGFGRCKGS